VQTFFGQGGFLRCGCLHSLVQKTLDFFKFMVRPHGQGGVEPLWTRGVNFLQFCEDVFYGPSGPYAKNISTGTSHCMHV